MLKWYCKWTFLELPVLFMWTVCAVCVCSHVSCCVHTALCNLTGQSMLWPSVLPEDYGWEQIQESHRKKSLSMVVRLSFVTAQPLVEMRLSLILLFLQVWGSVQVSLSQDGKTDFYKILSFWKCIWLLRGEGETFKDFHVLIFGIAFLSKVSVYEQYSLTQNLILHIHPWFDMTLILFHVAVSNLFKAPRCSSRLHVRREHKSWVPRGKCDTFHLWNWLYIWSNHQIHMYKQWLVGCPPGKMLLWVK